MKSAPKHLFYRDITKDEAQALRAVNEGQANAYQQRLALYVITNVFARAQDVLYISGSPDDTAFLNGRAYVGQVILKYLKIPVGKLDELPTHIER